MTKRTKPTQRDSGTQAESAELDRLREQIISCVQAQIDTPGNHQTALPGVLLMRSDAPGDKVYSVQGPMLCVMVQGQKQVVLSDQLYTYDPARYLVVSVDLPISGQVTLASSDAPYLCIGISLDPTMIFELLREDLALAGPARPGLFVSPTNVSLLDAVLRLVRLLDSPQEIRVLAPMIQREILFRLLQDDTSGAVRQLGSVDGQTRRVAKVIELIRREFSKPLSIERLAQEAGMSPSSLHQHFKAVTLMSPLQYQKQLRLQAARQLLLKGENDAAGVAFSVGYESPSHFSREYTRLFGLPPIKDLQRIREQGLELVG